MVFPKNLIATWGLFLGEVILFFYFQWIQLAICLVQRVPNVYWICVKLYPVQKNNILPTSDISSTVQDNTEGYIEIL